MSEDLTAIVARVRGAYATRKTVYYVDPSDAIALCAAVERLTERCNTLVEMCSNLETVAETAEVGARKAIAERERLTKELQTSKENANARLELLTEARAEVERLQGELGGIPELRTVLAARDAALAEVERLKARTNTLIEMCSNLETVAETAEAGARKVIEQRDAARAEVERLTAERTEFGAACDKRLEELKADLNDALGRWRGSC